MAFVVQLRDNYLSKKETRARTAEQKNRMMNKIIEKGRKMFVQTGMDGFSLRALAKELGMSHPNFYNYISSKKELWLLIRKEAFLHIKNGLETVVNSHEGSSMQLIDKLVPFYLDWAQEESERYLIMFQGIRPSQSDLDELGRNYDPVYPYDVVKNVINRGVESGEFHSKNPEYMSYVLFSIMHGASLTERDFEKVNSVLEPFHTTPNNDSKILRETALKAIHSILLDKDI